MFKVLALTTGGGVVEVSTPSTDHISGTSVLCWFTVCADGTILHAYGSHSGPVNEFAVNAMRDVLGAVDAPTPFGSVHFVRTSPFGALMSTTEADWEALETSARHSFLADVFA